MSLRAEFADMIRTARRSTGRPLRVASTVTVTGDNIDEVPDLVRWFIEHADAFRILSFQPAARVGRIMGRSDHVHRLEEFGVRGGARVEMFSPGNPCIIRLSGNKVCIRSDEMLSVLVKPQDGIAS